ncbi:zinc ribbon domain-containing protein [Dysgonomonas sp. ZJ279]|uniref:zinc ribbon domain-containing protein n=1 Tax=Dysgonomonas sp. ZJ279 TaxID=2709796 RepID=UPI0013EA54EC|nr:zinc ribbon domain-containing protein [Dysgonomonas sp. ZJ279]
MDEKFCQSCGMPLNTAADFGTNKDNSVNEDYCTYCFKEGSFAQDVTMDEMIDHCLNYLDEFNKDSDKVYSKEEARATMKEYFPNLKRWKTA